MSKIKRSKTCFIDLKIINILKIFLFPTNYNFLTFPKCSQFSINFQIFHNFTIFHKFSKIVKLLIFLILETQHSLQYFSFSMVNTSMPIVLLTIANSDGVHILSRFFREARKHKDVKKALTMTMNQLMLPIFLTSITTTAAFLTMVSSPIATMTGYGTTIGFGIMWAWVLSSTYLPAIIHLKKWDMNKAAIDQPSFLEKLIHRFGRSLLNYPKQVFLTGFLIVAVSSIGIWFINVEVNIINLFKPGHEIRESTLFLDREMAGSMNLILKVEGDLKDPEVLNKMIEIGRASCRERV